jgi:DNA repair protein RadC
VSDYELLELVLFRAIPQRDIKPLAENLIAKYGRITVDLGGYCRTSVI